MTTFPVVLLLKQQDQLSRAVLHKRLESILPLAMREAGIVMWLLICQEDNQDRPQESIHTGRQAAAGFYGRVQSRADC
jgi:hypothetical protein